MQRSSTNIWGCLEQRQIKVSHASSSNILKSFLWTANTQKTWFDYLNLIIPLPLIFPCLSPLLASDSRSSRCPYCPGSEWTGTQARSRRFCWRAGLRWMSACVPGSAAAAGWRTLAWWWGARRVPPWPGCLQPCRGEASQPEGCCRGCSGSAGGRREAHPPGVHNKKSGKKYFLLYITYKKTCKTHFKKKRFLHWSCTLLPVLSEWILLCSRCFEDSETETVGPKDTIKP